MIAWTYNICGVPFKPYRVNSKNVVNANPVFWVELNLSHKQDKMPLTFEMPFSLEADKFIAELSHRTDSLLISQQHISSTFYDSFDWRLYSNAISAEFIPAKPVSFFKLVSLENSSIIASTELSEVPAFSKQFKSEKIRTILSPMLEMRALLPVCTLDFQEYHLNILNKDEKTVLRIVIEEYEQLSNRVLLQPIKGYEKSVEHITEMLTSKLGLTENNKPILLSALTLQGRSPQDYSSKLNISLTPDMRADAAAKLIFSHLLKTMKTNEQGTIADTDSEFLHDYRVAIRRTRTGLSQLKGVLPENINAHFADFFSWLGQITGPTRDLDVYLLNFERYKNSLPISIREDINPLYDFLLAKKHKAQQELANKLRSEKYCSTLSEWETYLNEPNPASPMPFNATMTIKELANIKIWKNYKRVLHKGSAITSLTSAETFHELRKTCKKMRYLLEFFQSLYQDNQMTILIKKLKDLQEVLGDFQDYDVQECNLKKFSSEMLTKNIPVNTFLAMGVLIQNLNSHKCRARKQFDSRFEAYKLTEKQLSLKVFFGNQSYERVL
jgi:CHAD domain-containing protein